MESIADKYDSLGPDDPWLETDKQHDQQQH